VASQVANSPPGLSVQMAWRSKILTHLHPFFLRFNFTMHPLRVSALALIAALISSSCGGGGDGSSTEKTFVFRLHGFPASQEFVAKTKSPQAIAQARQQLQLPAAERRLFPIGAITSGNGGYNHAWRWHYADFALAENSIELCDGTPAMLEEDLEYWLGTVKSYCPWAAYVHAEIQ
jgi:hypothetical protein